MKLFCGCNREWVVDQPEDDDRFRFQSCTYSHGIGKKYTTYCPVCEMFTWIEPHYENMMFDLKNMNQM